MWIILMENIPVLSKAIFFLYSMPHEAVGHSKRSSYREEMDNFYVSIPDQFSASTWDIEDESAPCSPSQEDHINPR